MVHPTTLRNGYANIVATSALSTQMHVISALMLRDMQTRFGGSYVNYLIALGWPLAHIALLLVIYNSLGRSSPLGQDATVFFATGLVPYMVFQYPARFMMMSITSNRPLLAFPVVKMLDVMLARALLETITGFCVVCVTAGVLYGLGHNVMPRDPVTAISALAAAQFLAVGVGLVNAVIVSLYPFWIFVFLIFQIALYITSGILFVISALPEKAQVYLSWSPVTNVVTWFRSAYFDGYATTLIPDRTYPITFGLVCLLLALVTERFILPKLQPA